MHFAHIISTLPDSKPPHVIRLPRETMTSPAEWILHPSRQLLATAKIEESLMNCWGIVAGWPLLWSVGFTAGYAY